MIDGDSIAGFEADETCRRVPCDGCSVVPGFVDCHTHLPFAGWRAGEYALRIAGAGYAEIARSGGGIRASAAALAAADNAQVLEQARPLAAEMLRHGTTTIECKSGYGLSVDGELRALRLADQLGAQIEQTSTVTALLAHAVPDGFTASTWMDVIEGRARAASGDTSATALDIFVESIAFSNDDLLRMGRLAKQYGLFLRAHVEQLSSGTTARCRSRSRRERALWTISRACPSRTCPRSQRRIAAAAAAAGRGAAGGREQLPARSRLADAGAVVRAGDRPQPGDLPDRVAAADRRPGRAPLQLVDQEALLALTLNAAWVLDAQRRSAHSRPARRADVLLLDAPVKPHPYRLGHNPVAAAIVGGRPSGAPRPCVAFRRCKRMSAGACA